MTDKKLQKRRENRLLGHSDDEYKDIRRQRRKALDKALKAQEAADGEEGDEQTELTEGGDANSAGGTDTENLTIENDGMTNAQLTAILKGCGADISDAKNKAELLDAWKKVGDITVSMVSNEGLAEFLETHDIDLPDDADRTAMLEHFSE